eukprot:3940493-Rhodomonas_salina.5
MSRLWTSMVMSATREPRMRRVKSPARRGARESERRTELQARGQQAIGQSCKRDSEDSKAALC